MKILLALCALNIYPLTLSEKTILNLTTTDSSVIDRLAIGRLQAQKNELGVKDSLESKLYGGYNHETNRERPIIPFIPVFSPINQYQLGVKKKFKYGVSAALEASVDTRSTRTIRSAYTSTLSLDLGVDLWSNFLGRITKRELENTHLASKRLQLVEKLDRKMIETSGRKIYWTLVANQEKQQLSSRLLKTAKKQYKDSLKRQRDAIADQAEVSKYKSQIAQREGQLLFLKFERTQFIKTLRELFPSLEKENIKLGSYNIPKTIGEVLQCTQLISSNKLVPSKYTDYQETLSLLKKIGENQKLIDDSSSINVQLRTRVSTTGVGSEAVGINSTGDALYDGSLSGSIDDIQDNNRTGLAIGVQFDIPLGGSADKLKSTNLVLNQKKSQVAISDLEAKITSTHTQISESINILSKVLVSQRQNAEALSKRVKVLRKKFSQARIPLYALVQDEDALMAADLNLIDTQLTMLSTLLDYFMIFNKTPCQFNKGA